MDREPVGIAKQTNGAFVAKRESGQRTAWLVLGFGYK